MPGFGEQESPLMVKMTVGGDSFSTISKIRRKNRVTGERADKYRAGVGE